MILLTETPEAVSVGTRQFMLSRGLVEETWQSGLGRWICNLKVPRSNPPPQHYLGSFSIGSPEVNSSTALGTEIANWSASHQLEVLEFSMLYDLFATLVYFIYCVPS